MNKKKNIDKILLTTVLTLSIFGILMIYSSSSIWSEYKFNDSFFYVKHQLIFFVIGCIIMYIVSNINVNIYYKYSNKIIIVSIILLILVLIPGIGSIRNGSRSWFGIGSFGIQPSEACKISLIIFTSKYLSLSEEYLKSFKKGIFPILFITLICFGLIMLQPDLGTGLIMFLSIISILFIAGANKYFFISGGLLGIIGLVLLIIIAPYRMNRITSFINPWEDPLGTGFQMIQSLFAIGPSGLFGVGFLNSIQKHFYLPEPQTDFIFSVIAEEFGIVGVIFVVSCFLKTNDHFKKYLSFGITFQLIFQASLNLMVVVGLIPVTGVTLPFLSYGGSSLLVSMASIGIILNISKNNS